MRPWSGPLTTLLARHAPVAGDVEVTTASPGSPRQDPEVGWRITNAPSLPQPPRYSGSTMQDRRQFMRAYETYCRALCAFMTPFHRPFIMPKDPAQDTEEEWVAYFKEVLKFDSHDYSAVDDAMRVLHLDVSLPDAASRLGKLRADMHKLLDEHNVNAVMFEREQKRLYSLPRIPRLDQGAAEQRREQEAEEQRDRLLWVGMRASSLVFGLAACAEAVKEISESARCDSGPNERACGPTATDEHSATAGRAEASTRCSCGSCRSIENRVKQCPRTAPGEAEKLIAEDRAAPAKNQPRGRQLRQAPVVAPDAGQAARSSGQENGQTVADVDGAEVVSNLLHSGADDSTASAGLIAALQKKSASVSVAVAPQPSVLCPVGDEQITVSRSAARHNYRPIDFAHQMSSSAGSMKKTSVRCR
ncbi:hypothetical protein PybrP1_002321 [[Pythium] brassicae (nom. inval.)]|nr:hypothetical protein PybrP1_002321 [[Pythium] brassicae (nom. inval.)]